MDCIKSWFELKNFRWEKILSSPQKLEETLSRRLDADKLVFSPKLESPADERAERPEFRLISVAAALPVNSQSGSIAGQETDEHSTCNAKRALFRDSFKGQDNRFSSRRRPQFPRSRPTHKPKDL